METVRNRIVVGLLIISMIFIVYPTVTYAADAPGVYGDFYVVDNATGEAVTSDVSYANGILTIQRDGCRVKMKSGVSTTEDRIVFEKRGASGAHSCLRLENVHINTTTGVAVESKQRYSDINIYGDCEFVGTVGIQFDEDGGNFHVGSDSEAASLLAQGTSGAGFYCGSTIGFGSSANPVTFIGTPCAISIDDTSWLSTVNSEMKAGADKDNLTTVNGGFDAVNNNNDYKYVTLSANNTLTTHTITFNANDGSGTVSSQNVVDGRTFTLPNCGFQNGNMLFQGWAQGSATGTVSASGTEISNVTSDMTFYATWAKPKLTGITAPAAITGVANGTEKSASALGLPTTVTISTEDPEVTTAGVNWDLTTLASGTYNPSVLTEQTFTVNGTVTLPSTVDANGKALSTTVTVTVNGAPFVSDVSADLAAGNYTLNQNVVLTSATSDATIYYTTDGSEPSSSNGEEYTGPISVTGTEGTDVTTTIKAIAVKAGMQNSQVKSFVYKISLTPGTIAPGTADFNKYQPADIIVSITDGSYAFLGITNGSYTLVQGTDYTINGNEVTLKKEYLNKFSNNSTQTLVFDYSDGTDPRITININDTTPAAISPDTATFDRYAPADIKITKADGGYLLDSIKNGNDMLIKNIDYSITGNEVTISKNYLNKFVNGTQTLTFDYIGGNDPTLTIVIKDTKPDIAIKLKQANGGNISVTQASGLKKGDKVNVIVKANKGKKLSMILVNGKAISGTTFTMPDENVTITAVFTDITYKVSAVASTSKGGKVTGAKTVSYGGSVIIKAKAKYGYYFVKWMEKDRKVSTNSTLKIKNIKQAHSYKAVFKKMPVIFTLSKYGTGSIKVHWKSVNGAWKYQIMNNATSNGKYKIQWTGSNGNNTYLSLYKIKGKTYKFKMRYYKMQNGHIVWSSWTPVKCLIR